MNVATASAALVLVFNLSFTPTIHAEIVIGVATPLTGGYAYEGSYTQRSMEFAIEDLNARGGAVGEKLRIDLVDDQCDSETAALAARKLVEDKAVAVFGHDCSGAAIPASSVYEAAGIPFFALAATNPRLTERGLHYVFRLTGRDDEQAVLAADYLVEKFASKPLAIVHDSTVYGIGLGKEVLDELHRRGFHETLFEEIQPGQLDFAELIARLRNSKIEVVYFAGYPHEGGILMRQAWEGDLKIPAIAGDGIFEESYWTIAGPEPAKATLMANLPDFSTRPEAAPLIPRLKEAKFDPRFFNFQAYAGLQAWAQACEQAKTTKGVEVSKVLHARQFETLMGRIGFDEKGDLIGTKTWTWWTWNDGTAVPFEKNH